MQPLLDARTTKYDGKGRFSFDNYVEKLQFAFSELEECGDPQSESHKINVLTNGCTTEKMEHGTEWILGDEEKFDTFSKATAFLSGYCSRKGSRETILKQRHVSYAEASKSDEADDYSDLKESYSRAEWQKLSANTKSRVIARKRSRNKDNPKATSKSTPKRKIKQVQTDALDSASSSDESDTEVPMKTSSVKSTHSTKSSDSKPAAKKA